MADRAVRGTPYRTVRALSHWAAKRRGYLRGRLLLETGLVWDELEFREQLDVVEAVLGEGGGVDMYLDRMDDQIAEMFPEKDSWGASPGAQRGQAAAEATFAVPPRVGQKKSEAAAEAARRDAPPNTPPESVGTLARATNSFDDGVLLMMVRSLIAMPNTPERIP